MRAELANPAIDLGRREELAQDMAGTLDRAAQSAADPERAPAAMGARRSSLIDRFIRENPDLPWSVSSGYRRRCSAGRRRRPGSGRRRSSRPNPSTPSGRWPLLDDAIERLRSISAIGDQTDPGR